MIYVASDIHGDYEKYAAIFDKIKFTDTDTLFLLGDVLDRGTGSVKILLDMMCRPNLYPILGNHEYMAINILKKLNEEITNESLSGFDDDFIDGMIDWFKNGGESTLKEFKALSPDDREAVLEYLDEFTAYEEIRVNNKHYILVHAGLGNFNPNKSLDDYMLHELIFSETDYSKVYFKDKILVTGHTPVVKILSDDSADKILIQNNHIALDCGCGYGKNLGVLCLDTMEEFYI